MRWREVGGGPSEKEGLGYAIKVYIPYPLRVMDFNTIIILSLLKGHLM